MAGRAVQSAIGICNIALGHLAVGKTVTSFDEQSEDARTCLRWYEQARDEVLCAFPWPFARTFEALALVAGDGEVPAVQNYMYSYRYPSTCLKFERILNGISRVETRQTRVPYAIGQDDEGQLIYTDFPPFDATDTTLAQPQCEYTACQDDPGRYPPMFSQAVAALLAFYMAPALTAGDKFGLGNRAYSLYQLTIDKAQSASKNEEQADEDPDSEFQRARDGSVAPYGWPSALTYNPPSFP